MSIVRNKLSNAKSMSRFLPLVFALSFQGAYAKSAKSAVSESGSGLGPFAFVEWNPAALKDKAAQINGEYLVIDGVSFGTLVRIVDSSNAGFEMKSLSVGGTVTQYFFDQTLQGLFARGDISVFVDRYKVIDRDQAAPGLEQSYRETGYNTGVSIGLLAGYRAMLTEHITGSAGYGVIRNMPDFFASRGSSLQPAYVGNKGDWRFDVQVGLGVAF
jgi:hypothetical protein